MGFGAATQAMISSLKNNKRNRVTTFDKLKQRGYRKGAHIETVPKKKLSEDDLKRISHKTKMDNQNDLIKTLSQLFVITIIVVAILCFVLK
ncbi:MAG: hypothetical protein JEZ03_05430 [Bacteroidales bacterium]|nr:hypothetical protein [Bacteroidales bacterium]